MTSDTEFAPRARVVCVSSVENSFAAFTKPFRKAGYALLPPDQANNADLALIDLRGKRIAGKKAVAIANLLRRKSPECSLFFLIDPGLSFSDRNTLRRHGEIVCVSDDINPVIERCRQMIRLRNVAEETGERLKSLAALNRIVEFPSIATQNTPPRVLVAGDPGAAALPIINAISHICEQCACVLSVGQAMRALDHGKFDCAIFLPTDKNDPLFSLSRALGRHPKYCAMPIIHVVDSPEKTAIYAEVGAKDFILTSHISGDIAGKIQLSSRRARLARAMHAFLHACVGEGVRDPASGAFTPVFLAEHGARLCARADQTGRPLSAAIIRLSADNLRSKKIEPGRRALHQAVRLINRITRAEDVVARIAPETFLILMPAANEDAAARAALRVEGVLENTVFKSAHGNAPFALNALSAHCARPRGYCIEETVAHALRSLRAAEAETTRRPHRQFPR